MLKTILVPLDGSPLAESALGYAAELSIPTGARLLLLRAAYAHTLPGIDPRERKEGAIWEAEQYLTETAGKLIERGYNCEAVVPYGHAADCIIDQARIRNASLIVLNTHGRTGPGHLLLGSVAEAVVARSSVPVLVTRAWLPAQPDDLLSDTPVFIVTLDGSVFAEAALEPAVQLAEDFGAGLLLLTVQPLDGSRIERMDYLSDVQRRLRDAHPDVSIQVEFRYGDVPQAIDTACRECGASMVIMATHGRTGVFRSVLGSVAGKVVKDGHTPLVLIRPPAYVEDSAKQADAVHALNG